MPVDVGVYSGWCPLPSGVLFLGRPAKYVIWHQKGSTSQDGDFKSPKHE